MSLLVGTASWAAPSLLAHGQFYPPSVRTPAQRLAWYAKQFPLVEVDASYYALPAASTARAWATCTPAPFTFNVKAFRLFTGHGATPDALPADLRQAWGRAGAGRARIDEDDLPAELAEALWARFLAGVAPLEAAGKLGAVHCQFAPWVVNDRAGRARVARCVQRLRAPGRPVAVEFRHASWFAADAAARGTLAFEQDIGAAHVVVDGAQGLPNTVPPVWAVTDAQLGLLRLHGRNPQGWLPRPPGAGGGRFNYVYSSAELQAMVPALRWLDAQARRVHVVFNTNHESQGPRNARLMMQLLDSGAPAPG